MKCIIKNIMNKTEKADPLESIKKVAIAYTDVNRDDFPTDDAYLSEVEVEERAQQIAQIFHGIDHIEVQMYKGNDKLIPHLSIDRPDIVINLVDSVHGSEMLSSAIPASLDVAQIPYTGSSVYAFMITTNKYLVKETLKQYDIPTPDFEFVTSPNERIPKHLKYPLITKLNNCNGSLGITNDAVSDNETQLRKRLDYLFKTYKQPVIVEEFIEGRELSCVVLQSGEDFQVMFGEKVFTPKKDIRKYDFCSFDAVWKEPDSYFYEKYEDKSGRLTSWSKKCFDAFGLADYAKIDIRIDKNGRAYFIDINANPALGPIDTATTTVSGMYGMDFEEVLKRIMRNAMNVSKY